MLILHEFKNVGLTIANAIKPDHPLRTTGQHWLLKLNVYVSVAFPVVEIKRPGQRDLREKWVLRLTVWGYSPSCKEVTALGTRGGCIHNQEAEIDKRVCLAHFLFFM